MVIHLYEMSQWKLVVIVPALGRLIQEYCLEVKASLCYLNPVSKYTHVKELVPQTCQALLKLNGGLCIEFQYL